jgi:class 3 adenylate cyclase/tetratricopeptide (TPR) repeat protein
MAATMEFDDLLARVLDLLRRDGRVSYRALKVRFRLDDDVLAALKDEIIDAKRLAIDEGGKLIVWKANAASPVTETPETPAAARDERRQLTVLFCDLAGSTALSSRLDPEDFREVVRAYQASCAEVVGRFEGHVAQYLGDGLLVYHGYPQAHEDDPQRAVRAGLGIVQAIGALNATLASRYGVRIAVRLGIHTGPVVVGEMGTGGHREHLALGETPNLAAKIQGLAAPDTLAISDATYRLTEGYFVCEDLGHHVFQPDSPALHLRRVVAESEARSRWEVAVAVGLKPLVGRDDELHLLERCWERSSDGNGQVVLLRGEAGIGKSRLVEALHDRATRTPHTPLRFRCSPYATHSAFHPLIDALERSLEWRRDDTPADKLAKLERMLGAARLPLAEVVPLFAALLSLPLPGERVTPHRLAPEERQQTQEALVTWLLAETEQRPVLAVWEDLHWADPSTLELLDLVVAQAPAARMLTLLTARLEFASRWSSSSALTHITLSRLAQPHVEQMTAHITKGKSLPPEVMRQVVAKTDGVPLFVEELLKMILESPLLREEADRYVLAGPLPPLAIPATLQDSLMARLDRLSSAREVAQLCAVLGREFTYELVRAVTDLDDAALRQALDQLSAAELIHQRGRGPRASYVFKHALIQDIAYASQVKSTQQWHHQRIAQVLIERFADVVEAQPELLAYHYTAAGLVEQAIPYWRRAGERAAARSGNVEAVGHLSKALGLLATLPETDERARQELELQLALGSPLMIVKGQAAPEVERVYGRARELAERLEDRPRHFAALTGLARFAISAGRLGAAREVAGQALALAEQLADPVLRWQSHLTFGSTGFYLGQIESARSHLEQGLALHAPQEPRFQAIVASGHPQVLGLSQLALTLWLLGYPDQALSRSVEALAVTRRSPHPYTLARALYYAGSLYRRRREPAPARECAEALIALAREHGFTRWLGFGLVTLGSVLIEQGATREGLAELRHGVEIYQTVRDEVGVPGLLATLAEGYLRTDDAIAGLPVVGEALEVAGRTREAHWDAELHRLRGELLLPKLEEAEACFERALTIARHQRARSLELRGALSMHRLRARQGRAADGRRELAPVYGSFTEGFETGDLKEAKAVLDGP